MWQKRPAIPTTTGDEIPVACPLCEYLEVQVDGAIAHISEVLESGFQSVKEKVRELHRWQEKRDEALEEFYSHKRLHRIQIVNVRGRKIA